MIGSDPEPESISLVCTDQSLEENDILLAEVFSVDLVRWWHAVTVSEPVNAALDVGLGVWTEALRLQMGLELEGPCALGVGRGDAGRLYGGLRVRLCRRHGGLLNTWRVGAADGGGGLVV